MDAAKRSQNDLYRLIKIITAESELGTNGVSPEKVKHQKNDFHTSSVFDMCFHKLIWLCELNLKITHAKPFFSAALSGKTFMIDTMTDDTWWLQKVYSSHMLHTKLNMIWAKQGFGKQEYLKDFFHPTEEIERGGERLFLSCVLENV